ncbi:MAG: hypothetical protein AB1757_11450 [Acidobacteriota bacterium]
MDKTTESILVAVDDMFFAAKILATAKTLGKTIERVKSTAEIQNYLDQKSPSLLLIDLNATKFDAIDLIRAIKADKRLEKPFIVGFLSHVQVDLKNRALEAGCNVVMPRSAFSQKLAEVLNGNIQ